MSNQNSFSLSKIIVAFILASILLVLGDRSARAQNGKKVYLPLITSSPAIITVDTTKDELTDNGHCSLREAIMAANRHQAVDTCPAGQDQTIIEFSNEDFTPPDITYTLTLIGADEDDNATGDLDITSNITIHGESIHRTVIDGNQLDRVLHIHSGAHVTLQNVMIRHGKTPNGVINSDPCGDGENGGGIANFGTLWIQGSAISDNTTGDGGGICFLSGAGGAGGGIFNAGFLTLIDSIVNDNYTGKGGITVGVAGGHGTHGGDGGGIVNLNRLVIQNSTISGNRTGDGSLSYGYRGYGGPSGYGGGIDNQGVVSLDYSTISDNRTGKQGTDSYISQGGGIYNHYNQGTVQLRNTLVGTNVSTGAGPDCWGILSSYGYNLIQDVTDCTVVGDVTGNITNTNPGLYGLDDYGGPTWTQGLRSASPAVNAGSCIDMNGISVAHDQRGEPRPSGGACDIGAYELH